MYDYRIVEQVSRKKKHMSGTLRKVMVIFAVDFCTDGYHDLSGIYASGISSGAAIFCL